MMTTQMGCKEFLMQNKQKFGITENNLKAEYLDICAKNVRCIASRRINEDIVLPSMSSFINSCTGLVDTAGGIDTQFASLRVTHAHEELVDCDTNCPGVKVTIKGQIIVRTRPTGCNCAVSYLAIPVELVSETIRDFHSTATGERIKDLRTELPNIDGSCMVINLSCRVCREVCNGCSRYVAQVKGSIVDKLWKMENIWVEGWRPYQSPSITVCDRFEKDFCGCGSVTDNVWQNPGNITRCCGDECCDECDGCGCANCGCGCPNCGGGYANGCGCNVCGCTNNTGCGGNCGCGNNGGYTNVCGGAANGIYSSGANCGCTQNGTQNTGLQNGCDDCDDDCGC